MFLQWTIAPSMSLYKKILYTSLISFLKSKMVHWKCYSKIYHCSEIISGRFSDQRKNIGYVCVCVKQTLVGVTVEKSHGSHSITLMLDNLWISYNMIIRDNNPLNMFFFSCGLSHHLGSQQRSSMVLRHRLLSSAIFLSIPTIVMSRFTESTHLVHAIPLFFPSGFMPTIRPQACSSGRLLT